MKIKSIKTLTALALFLLCLGTAEARDKYEYAIATFRVTEEGTTENIEFIYITDAEVTAIISKQIDEWTFKPATREGVAMASKMHVNLRLNKKDKLKVISEKKMPKEVRAAYKQLELASK